MSRSMYTNQRVGTLTALSRNVAERGSAGRAMWGAVVQGLLTIDHVDVLRSNHPFY